MASRCCNGELCTVVKHYMSKSQTNITSKHHEQTSKDQAGTSESNVEGKLDSFQISNPPPLSVKFRTVHQIVPRNQRDHIKEKQMPPCREISQRLLYQPCLCTRLLRKQHTVPMQRWQTSCGTRHKYNSPSDVAFQPAVDLSEATLP